MVTEMLDRRGDAGRELLLLSWAETPTVSHVSEPGVCAARVAVESWAHLSVSLSGSLTERDS